MNALQVHVAVEFGYGPFGEVIRASGPMATANPFRLSPKYADDETDLLYYGYRYYSASTGRWLSRDRIEETGGKNLYAFVGSRPVTRVDSYGESDLVWLRSAFVVGHKANSGGVTMWYGGAPDAKVYCRWSGCCCGVRLCGGGIGTWGIINEGTTYGKSIVDHEWYHVNYHFKPAYEDYKSAAGSLGAPCITKGRAMCLKPVILSECIFESKARAVRAGVQYDWDDCGRDKADPETRAERQAALSEAIRQYGDAKAATAAAVAACEASNQ